MSSESENPEEKPNFDDEEFLLDGIDEIEKLGEPEETEDLTDQDVLGDEEDEDYVLVGAEGTPPEELPSELSDEVPSEALGEMIEGVLGRMKLPRNDASGHALTYHARLEREGRHLHGSEVIGDSLQSGDQVVLQPNIDAGGCK